MRFSIRHRLFAITFGMLALSVVSATLVSSLVTIRRATHARQAELERVVRTLSAATYPRTLPVLEQMHGLCGAHFVVFSSNGQMLRSTLPALEQEDDAPGQLRQAVGSPSESGPAQAVVQIDGQAFDARAIAPHGEAAPRLERLVVLYPKRSRWTISFDAAWPIVLGGTVILVAAGGLSLALASSIVAPIRSLRNQAEMIAEGQFEIVALPRWRDELRDLAQSLNQMARRLAEHEEQIRRQERLSTISRLGAGIAHQLRNSATGARMALDLCDRNEMGQETRVAVDRALEQMRLMESHIQRFLALGQTHDRNRQHVDLAPLIEATVDLLRPGARHQRVRLEWTPPAESAAVWADRQSLMVVLTNLVLNAIDAVATIPEAQRCVRIDLRQEAPHAMAEIDVSDHGSGPPKEIADQLFSPFVTGKADGTGLGLHVAACIASEHNGVLTWWREGDWTTFRLRLPGVQAETVSQDDDPIDA